MPLVDRDTPNVAPSGACSVQAQKELHWRAQKDLGYLQILQSGLEPKAFGVLMTDSKAPP